MQNVNWYQTLTKPELTPPDGMFMPVWTILYAMIFISLFLFLKTGELNQKIIPLTCFAIQLTLNFFWSPVFFGMQKIELALWIICLMWIFILATIFTFYPYAKSATILLIPYFIWVSFATYLNWQLWKLNVLL